MTPRSHRKKLRQCRVPVHCWRGKALCPSATCRLRKTEDMLATAHAHSISEHLDLILALHARRTITVLLKLQFSEFSISWNGMDHKTAVTTTKTPCESREAMERTGASLGVSYCSVLQFAPRVLHCFVQCGSRDHAARPTSLH